ncbi:hypothetical protein [Streptomyces koelreuteriae]|uniref:hypothetical protein n=1 Tax=Streptomyces koelreuteriae TaxID=2838015 RepID=UPI003EBE0D89
MSSSSRHAGPPPASSFPDRGALLQARTGALDELIKADRSLPRALLSLLCALIASLGVLVITSLLVGTATDEEGAPGLAYALLVSLGALLLLVGAPVFVLHRQRARGMRIWTVIKQWMVLDRHPEAPAVGSADDLGAELGEVPDTYGSSAFPRLRFILGLTGFLASVTVALTVAAVLGLTDRAAVGWFCALLTFAVYSGAVVRKTASRSSWIRGERQVRMLGPARSTRHAQLAATAPDGPVSESRIPDNGFPLAALWYSLPLVITIVLYFGNSPESATGYVVAGVICAVVLCTALILVARSFIRERRECATVSASLVARFPEKRVHVVRHGLQPESLVPVAGLAAWDFAPQRVSGLCIDEHSLTMLSPEGETLDLPLARVLGATVIKLPHRDVELHLVDGQCLLLRSFAPQEIIDSFRSAGLRVDQVTGP